MSPRFPRIPLPTFPPDNEFHPPRQQLPSRPPLCNLLLRQRVNIAPRDRNPPGLQFPLAGHPIITSTPPMHRPKRVLPRRDRIHSSPKRRRLARPGRGKGVVISDIPGVLELAAYARPPRVRHHVYLPERLLSPLVRPYHKAWSAESRCCRRQP